MWFLQGVYMLDEIEQKSFLDPFLAPIEGDNPCGVDLREDSSPISLYYQIKDERTAARNIERQQISPEDMYNQSKPHWKKLHDLATEVLVTKTKDIEIAAWLTEALLRLKGFEGLQQGFSIVRSFSENFWEGVYPLPDEDGLADRISPLAGLNGIENDGTLISPILGLSITDSHQDDNYAFWQYRQAFELSRLADDAARQKRIDSGAIALSKIEVSVAHTDISFFNNLIANLQACQEEFQKLTALLDEKCGHDSPPSSNIKNTLQSCFDEIHALVGERLKQQEADSQFNENSSEESDGNTSSDINSNARIKSREQAFDTIRKTAAYFRLNEPHSPLSYMLERVVLWGSLSLPQLLDEIINDENAKEAFCQLTGIAVQNTDANSD